MFDNGIFPEFWSEGVVIAVPKSGDLSDPNNYRPIILVSVLSKIFTSILTKRMVNWAEDEEKLIDNQFGFRPGRSTIDAIFVMHGIIQHLLHHKHKVFCAFVDFRKAFDKVIRRILWYKLLLSGLSSKFISIVKSVYESVRLRIRTDGNLSNAFDNFLGVKQGELLSPLLFLFFINDIIQDIHADDSDGIFKLNNYLIYLILFADDTVLFSKSPETLQILLDKLSVYCRKWNIVVNSDKTKVMVFRNGWQPVNVNFYYEGHELEIVNSYIYLGMLLHFNGKFAQTQKRISQQGSRALSSLINSLSKVYITIKQKCLLFNSMVGSVLNYASEIWGFHRANEVEIVHNRFCRNVLKLGRNVPKFFLYGELGHLPMSVIRKYRIIKYWLHILHDKPKFVYDVYKLLCTDAALGKVNWAYKIRDLLYNLGLNYVWLEQENINVSFEYIKNRINDQYYQNWHASLTDCEKLSLYCSYKTDFVFENYLHFDCNFAILTKLRSGTLKLYVETGRYDNTPRLNRVCKCCFMNCIEDEYHFVLICPTFRSLRCHFLPKYYCSWPNTRKLKLLLCSESRSLTNKLCQYLNAAWKLRSQII